MKERKGIFKGYSIDNFWPLFIEHTIDSMNFANILSGGDYDKRKEIMTGLYELLYCLYNTTFDNKQKFFDYANETVLAVLDTKYPINDNGTVNVEGILETLKNNWTKNYNFIYDNTKR